MDLVLTDHFPADTVESPLTSSYGRRRSDQIQRGIRYWPPVRAFPEDRRNTTIL